MLRLGFVRLGLGLGSGDRVEIGVRVMDRVKIGVTGSNRVFMTICHQNLSCLLYETKRKKAAEHHS
jgi:hypothetical protein